MLCHALRCFSHHFNRRRGQVHCPPYPFQTLPLNNGLQIDLQLQTQQYRPRESCVSLDSCPLFFCCKTKKRHPVRKITMPMNNPLT